MIPRIATLLPPGGFSNLVGYHMSALDLGLARIRRDAEQAAEDPRPLLRQIAELEIAWVHRGLGKVPTPRPPAESADVATWLGWMESVRTVTQMVLRPLQDRDLERLLPLADAQDGVQRTLRRMLAELLFEHGRLCGRIA